jgi:hypothetical protein
MCSSLATIRNRFAQIKIIHANAAAPTWRIPKPETGNAHSSDVAGEMHGYGLKSCIQHYLPEAHCKPLFVFLVFTSALV